MLSPTPQSDTPPVEMILDADDLIVACNQGWDAFARDNEGEALTGSALIGKPFLDAITGKVTRAFTQSLLERVRAADRPMTLPYRCDSPTQRRFMCMELSPLEGGWVRLRHWLVRSEPLILAVRLETARQRGRDTLIRCSMCNLVKRGEEWLEPATLARELPLGAGAALTVTYGICPACARLAEGAVGPAQSGQTSQETEKRADGR